MKKLAALACLGALPLFAPRSLPGQAPVEKSPIERAWSLAAAGDRAGAESLLQTLVKQQPNDPEVRLLLGSLLVEDDAHDAAIAELEQAIRLRPKWGEALNALGEAHRRFNEPRAAEEWFAKACSADPKLGIAQSNYGSALLAKGDAAGAASHLDRAIALMGSTADAADAYYLRAKIDAQDGKTQNAVQHLEKAVALRPDLAEAWSDLGQALQLTGEDDRAVTALERAVQLNGNDAVARYRLGAEYLRRGDVRQAISHLEVANRLSPEDQSILNSLASALRQAGRSEDAAAVRQRLAGVIRRRDRASQDHLQAIRLNNEGAGLEKTGDLAAALDRYGQAAALYPEHVGIETNYAVALLRLGRWEEGLKHLHNALERDHEDVKLRRAWEDALKQAPSSISRQWTQPRQ